jgi:glycerophosphoryl diester phosphodiesterase
MQQKKFQNLYLKKGTAMIFRCLFFMVVIFIAGSSVASGSNRIVIATQESTSPLASNTLPSMVYAMTTGANLVEYQLVLTQDNQLVAYNNLTLDGQTNVAVLYPERNREDGKYYVIDFNLKEIQQLSLTEPRLDMIPGYHIPSFQDILLLHGYLEKELDRKVGLYLEIKSPWFHSKEGRDISDSTLKLLKQNGFTGMEERSVYIQCYDPEELQRIHNQLLPAMKMGVKLVQLLDVDNGNETQRLEGKKWVGYDYGWLYTKLGLKIISTYADALGVESSFLLNPNTSPFQGDYTQAAKGLGIQIHAKGVHNQELTTHDSTPFTDTLSQLFIQVEAEAITTNNWIEAATFLKNQPQNAEESAANNTTEAEENPLNSVDLKRPAQVRDTATQF